MPVVRLHGPFGYMPFSAYDELHLFAGGIGITPMISVFAELHKALLYGGDIRPRRVVLYWSVPSLGIATLFEEIFTSIEKHQADVDPAFRIFEANIFITRTAAVSISGVTVRAGRPCIRDLLNAIRVPGAALAAVCGPPPLVQDVSVEARRLGCDFHTEEFAF
eukprot:m.17217 g.17217  ORF g.17217 m.17217 type:complete len:163 (-) comp3221_c0_seq1:219-707(-)